MQNQAAVIVDSGVTVVNDAGNITGGKVSITSGFASGDTLACTNSGTITCSYNATTGILTFTGTDTPANWQAIFRTVTIATTSASTTARTVAFTIGSAIPYSGNGHFYEFVASSGISWTAANTAANGKNLFGLQGYLVTVTSAEENSFVSSKLQGEGWMGASDVTTESDWKWVTGPEAGTTFFTQTGAADNSQNLVGNGGSVYNSTPGGGTAVGGYYNNWQSEEPNDYSAGEDYAHFRNNGTWNDYPNSIIAIAGYVVEYGGMAGDPSVTLTASKTVNNTASYTVTYNGNSNTGGTAPTDGSSPYASGSTVTVLGNTGSLVKTGYTFAGWNTAANGSGTAYSAGATLTIAADTTLYAQWTITYTVTANATGNGTGTVASNTGGISYTYQTSNTGTTSAINYGTSVVVTATGSNSTVSWGGTCTAAGGVEAGNGTGTATCTFSSLNSNKTVTATFSSTVTVPTMTEWGMIIFMLLAGLGSIYYLRRRRA